MKLKGSERFTDAKVRGYRPKVRRYEVFEGGGFGLRISPKGRKSWIWLYRFDGKPRRMSLGTYPQTSLHQAHAKLAKAREKLAAGQDPGAQAINARRADAQSATVTELAAEYIKRHAKPNKKSWCEDHRILKNYVLPKLGRRKAADVKRRDIINLIDGIADRAPIQANRVLALVRKMYSFAVGRDLAEMNPCTAVQAPGKEQRRNRVLNESEIQRFWAVTGESGHMPEPLPAALRFLLTTAQRPSEVANMRWDEIDGDWWTIPEERAKNGLPHRVFLADSAQKLLAARKQGSTWVFPAPRRDGPIRADSLSKATRANAEVFGFDRFTPHDLRRTAASHMTSNGTNRLVVGKILNHAESSVTAVYDRHSYDAEKRNALAAWGARLRAIVGERMPQGLIRTKATGARNE